MKTKRGLSTKPIYLGLENEFQVNEGEFVEFRDRFPIYLRKYTSPYIGVVDGSGKTADLIVRSIAGATMEADGNVAEFGAAMVRVRPGFSIAAINDVHMARRELLRFVSSNPQASLIGYSTHYNLTDWTEFPTSEPDLFARTRRTQLLRTFGPAYTLLALNPLSSGVGFRDRREQPGKMHRLELTADYLHDEQQLAAFALFYVGSVLNYETNKHNLPLLADVPVHTLKIPDRPEGNKLPNMLTRGRHTLLRVHQGKQTKRMTAGEYLQAYVAFLEPALREISTDAELENLWAHASGTKEVEFDKVAKYESLKQLKQPTGMFLQNNINTLRMEEYEERPLSPIAALFAALTHPPNGVKVYFRDMHWDKIHLALEGDRRRYNIQGIGAIEWCAEAYAAASDKRGALEDIVRLSPWLQDIRPDIWAAKEPADSYDLTQAFLESQGLIDENGWTEKGAWLQKAYQRIMEPVELGKQPLRRVA
jgi:hypothetical protein